MGNNLIYEIGFLEYSSNTNVGTLSRQLIIGLSVGAVVLILILVVCLIVYRQKSNQNSRVLKSMQEQMDVLELRVAAECKEGKAQLRLSQIYVYINMTMNSVFHVKTEIHFIKFLKLFKV